MPDECCSAEPARLRAPLEVIPRDYNFADDIVQVAIWRPGAPPSLPISINAKVRRTKAGPMANSPSASRFGNLLRRPRHSPRAAHAPLSHRHHRLADRVSRRRQGRRRAVPVNTLLSEDDYRFMLEDSRARLLVVSEELYPRFAGLSSRRRPRACHRLGRRRATASRCSKQLLAGATGDPMTGADRVRRHLLLALYVGFDRQAQGRGPYPCRPAAHRRSLRRPDLGITENDICYSVAKLFFAYGLGNALTFPLSAGATTVLLPERPTPEAIADILKKHRVTVFYAVPTFYAAFLASAAAPERDEVELRCCVSAGEALPSDVGRRFSERYGVDILDGLGSTEMLHIFVSNRAGEVKYGTTGKPVPGYDMRLVDDDGKIVEAQGEMGELQVRGPTSAVMYWNNREQSRATFLGEWTRSGDKYLEDEQGYFVYCGRRDDMLKVGGIYVAPFEVEGVLQSHPDVLEAAVVGWPDGDRLIKPKAFVVLKSPQRPGEATQGRLAGPLPGKACAVQISALARIPQRVAEDRDRQDSALQAAGRGGSALSRLWRRRDRLSRRKIADFLLFATKEPGGSCLAFTFSGYY